MGRTEKIVGLLVMLSVIALIYTVYLKCKNHDYKPPKPESFTVTGTISSVGVSNMSQKNRPKIIFITVSPDNSPDEDYFVQLALISADVTEEIENPFRAGEKVTAECRPVSEWAFETIIAIEKPYGLKYYCRANLYPAIKVTKVCAEKPAQ